MTLGLGLLVACKSRCTVLSSYSTAASSGANDPEIVAVLEVKLADNGLGARAEESITMVNKKSSARHSWNEFRAPEMMAPATHPAGVQISQKLLDSRLIIYGSSPQGPL